MLIILVTKSHNKFAEDCLTFVG